MGHPLPVQEALLLVGVIGAQKTCEISPLYLAVETELAPSSGRKAINASHATSLSPALYFTAKNNKGIYAMISPSAGSTR